MTTPILACYSRSAIVLSSTNSIASINNIDWNDWTSWSQCSTVCGPGISTRTRVCPRYAPSAQDIRSPSSNSVMCNGPSIQIKVCSVKVCPTNFITAHQKLCSKYNTRMFSGRRFVWESFIHSTNVCKVLCRAKGEHFYANLADNVQDGTPCSSGLIDSVCIKGACKTIGCDGVVESSAVKDTCSVCNGDGSSCRTISGIFTSKDLKLGTQHILNIPSGSTNITIAELGTSRNTLLLRTIDDKPIISNFTSSSVSRIVEAAGTVFKYEARSSSNRRESITSMGPTNITVVLQLLVRGSNPGIMYNLSVPLGMGDMIIQQIKHGSKLGGHQPKYRSVITSQGSFLKDGKSMVTQGNYTKRNHAELIRKFYSLKTNEKRYPLSSEVIKSSHLSPLMKNYSTPSVEINSEQQVAKLGSGHQSWSDYYAVRSNSISTSNEKSIQHTRYGGLKSMVFPNESDPPPVLHVGHSSRELPNESDPPPALHVGHSSRELPNESDPPPALHVGHSSRELPNESDPPPVLHVGHSSRELPNESDPPPVLHVGHSSRELPNESDPPPVLHVGHSSRELPNESDPPPVLHVGHSSRELPNESDPTPVLHVGHSSRELPNESDPPPVLHVGHSSRELPNESDPPPVLHVGHSSRELPNESDPPPVLHVGHSSRELPNESDPTAVLHVGHSSRELPNESDPPPVLHVGHSSRELPNESDPTAVLHVGHSSRELPNELDPPPVLHVGHSSRELPNESDPTAVLHVGHSSRELPNESDPPPVLHVGHSSRELPNESDPTAVLHVGHSSRELPNESDPPPVLHVGHSSRELPNESDPTAVLHVGHSSRELPNESDPPPVLHVGHSSRELPNESDPTAVLHVGHSSRELPNESDPTAVLHVGHSSRELPNESDTTAVLHVGHSSRELPNESDPTAVLHVGHSSRELPNESDTTAVLHVGHSSRELPNESDPPPVLHVGHSSRELPNESDPPPVLHVGHSSRELPNESDPPPVLHVGHSSRELPNESDPPPVLHVGHSSRELPNESDPPPVLHVGHSSRELPNESDPPPVLHVGHAHDISRPSTSWWSHSLNSGISFNKTNSLSTDPGSQTEDFILNKNNRLGKNKHKLKKQNYETTADNVMNNESGRQVNKNSKQGVGYNYSVDYNATLSKLEKEKIRNVLKDHQFRFSKDDVDPYKDDIFEGPMQSVRIPVNSVVDPNEIENWNPDSNKFDDKEEIRNIQNFSSANSSLQLFSFKKLEVDNELKKIVQENSKLSNLGITFSGDTSFKTLRNEVVNDSSKLPQNKNNSRHIEDEDELNRSTSRSRVSPAKNSKFIIPKYSQSFTFAERLKNWQTHSFKDNDSHRSSSIQLGNSLHYSNHIGPQNVAEGVSLHKMNEGRNKLATNVDRQTGSLNRSDPHFDKFTGNVSRTTLAEIWEQSNTVGIFSKVKERTQISTQERQIEHKANFQHNKSVEENRIRMREHRRLYNERLREFKEKLKQRQSELETSYRRSLHSNIINANGNRSSFENDYQRKQDGLSTNNSFQLVQSKIKMASALPIKLKSPPSLEEAHPQQAELVQLNRDDSMTRHGNVSSQRDPSFVISHKETTPSIYGYNVTEFDYDFVIKTPNEVEEKQFHVKNRQTEEVNSSPITRNSGPDISDFYTRHQISVLPGILPGKPQVKSEIISRKHRDPSENYDKHIIEANSLRTFRTTSPPRFQQLPDNKVLLPHPGKDVSRELLQNHVSVNKHTSANEKSLHGFHHSNLEKVVDLSKRDYLGILSTDYVWKVSGLNECTHSCGGGIQQTVTVCVDSMTQAVVTNENCRQILKPETLIISCNKKPCPAKWIPGPWSACTVSCGSGDQVRFVTCQARLSPTLNLTMPNASCAMNERIPDRQACSNSPCSSWKLGVWSNCLASCGDSIKTRDVQCVDPDDKVLSDNDCADVKPHSEEQCNLAECGRGWFFTDWTQECSSKCGTGVLTRDIICEDELGSGSSCDNSSRPSQTQPCRTTSLCVGSWVTGEWSKCDVKCGLGKRRRKVLCVHEFSVNALSVAGDDSCDKVNKPTETESCELPPCKPEWYMSSWSECSRRCGTGYQTREVKCLGPDQSYADNCTLDTRPKDTNTCNIQSCIHAVAMEKASICTDEFEKCSFVKRARLCRFDYYQKMCCQSCTNQT